MSNHECIDKFINRWENSGASERAKYQMFLSELCHLLEIAPPDPTTADPEKNLYVFDRAVTRTYPDGSSVTNYIDLYKASHFVWETKQGSSEIIADDNATPAPSKTGHGKRGSASEEKRGLIRWLRPEYQNPQATQSIQPALTGTEAPPQSKFQNQKLVRRSLGEVGSSIVNPASTWPDRLPEQVQLIRQLLSTTPTATADQLSQQFGRKNQKRTDQIEGIIETLKGLGQV